MISANLREVALMIDDQRHDMGASVVCMSSEAGTFTDSTCNEVT